MKTQNSGKVYYSSWKMWKNKKILNMVFWTQEDWIFLSYGIVFVVLGKAFFIRYWEKTTLMLRQNIKPCHWSLNQGTYQPWFIKLVWILVLIQKELSGGILQKVVLRNFVKFTWKHLGWSVFYDQFGVPVGLCL